MKKILAVLMGFLVFATPVIAANSFDMDVGELPNQWTYGFKRLGENLGLMFTFDNQKRAELQYACALRRMAEAEEMDELGKYEYTNQLMERYQYRLEKVQEYLETAEELGEDAIVLGERVQQMTQVKTQALQRLRQHVPEDAKAGIDSALQVTDQVRQRIRTRLLECNGELNQEQNQNETENQEQNMEDGNQTQVGQ